MRVRKLKSMIATFMTLAMLTTLISFAAFAEDVEVVPAQAGEVEVVFDLQEVLAPIAAGTTITTAAVAGISRPGAGAITVRETVDGRKYLERSGRTADWHSIEISAAALNLEAGRDYVFTFRGYMPQFTTLQVANSNYTNNIIWSPSTVGHFEEIQEYDALPANLAGIPIRIQTNGCTNTFTITDVIVTTTREPGGVEPAEVIWDLTEAAADLADGAPVAALGPASPGGGAVVSARQNIIIQDPQGWPEQARAVGAGLEVLRADAADGLVFCPEELGLTPGGTYIWEFEGFRLGGTHRAAFGTVNAAGVTTIAGPAENMLANDQGFRNGYFRLARGITHTDAIEAYRFYGVAAGNLNPAAGDFLIANITITRTSPFVLFETDFSSPNEDISMFTDGSATFDPALFGIVPDPYQPGNYVLQSIVPEGRGGDFWGIALQGAAINAPLGAMWRVTMDVRLRASSNAGNQTIRLRAATNLLGAVNNWAAFQAQHALPVSTEWTTYVAGPHLLPDFNGIHAFELMRASQTWTGTVQMNNVRVEVLYQPENQDDPAWQLDIPSLSDSFIDYFKVGNILDRLPNDDLAAMFIHHYNAITMENAMKPDAMSGGRGSYNFANADAVTDWAIANGIEMTGHALLWHSQSATWVHGVAVPGQPGQSTVEHAQARIHMEEFINNVAGHFSGRVVAWDVLNEVVVSGGGNGSWTQNIRGSQNLAAPTHPWSRAYNTNHIPGTPWGILEFIYDGFIFARAAAPDAQLLYNDYNDDLPLKSANIRDMVNAINARWATDTVNNPQASADFGTAVFTARTTNNNCPYMIADRATNIAVIENYLAAGGRLLVEGLGLQAHYGFDTSINNIRAAVERYTDMPGVRLHVTELDITTGIPRHGFGNNPGTRESGQRLLYRQIFELYMDNAHLFERITFWGVSDSNSWRGSSSPQLFASPTKFDPVFRAKPVFYDVVELPQVHNSVGIDSMFTGGGREITVAAGAPIELSITLSPRGGLALGGTSTNPADYRIKDLPPGLQVVAGENGVVTVQGQLEPGRYEIFPWARKGEVVTGPDELLDRVIGDWVGTRLTQPLVIYVTEAEQATFDLISFTYAWSEKLTAIVIDLGEGNSIATAALDIDTFNVHALHNRPTGNAWFFMNAYRTISDIYASNVNDWGHPAESGRFIVVEFKVWGPYGGLATGDGGARMRFQYTVTVNEDAPLLGGEKTLSDFNFVQSNLNPDGFGFTRNAIIDQFETTFGRTVPGITGSLTYNTFLSRDENGEPLKNRPLFIHFHGGGQGSDWRQPLGYSNNGTILAEPYWQERYQAHILVPINATAVGAQAILAEVIREMAADGYVDINRVVISGYSMGGTATINFMIRHPELVAAAVPICPANNPNTIPVSDLLIIQDIPQWWLNSEGEYSNAGHATIWTNVERFFGRAGGRLTARACRVNPVGRPPIDEPILVDGNAHLLNDVRYTRFWDNNVKAWPYGPDLWLPYTHLDGVTDDGFWIFNGHQVWIPAFNGGVNVMEEYTMGWVPREPYDGFTPGDSTALFDWMFAQSRATITFNLYTDNPTILDAFADYTTVVDGRARIVVSAVPEAATATWPGLEAIANIGHIFGTAEAHGYAFWGWFDDEALDASGRMRAGLRRPALAAPSSGDPCVLADLLAQIDAGAVGFEGGNINLYGVWVRWGDVDDNGAVNMADLNLLQRHINLGHVVGAEMSAAAADVVVDGQLNMADLSLLQRHANLGHIMTVVLGAEPQ